MNRVRAWWRTLRAWWRDLNPPCPLHRRANCAECDWKDYQW